MVDSRSGEEIRSGRSLSAGHPLMRLIWRRTLSVVPLALGVVTLVFLLMSVLPGDAVDLYVGPGMSSEIRDQVRSNLGLDEPVAVRYGKWLGAVARGDLGHSISRNRPVTRVVAELLPNTLLLSATALALAFVGGVLIGVVQAVRRHTWLDSGLSVVALFFYSMPSFWLALMMVLLFGYHADAAGWPIRFPPSGMQSVDAEFMTAIGRFRDRVAHLVLPAASLALVIGAGITRYTRASMLEAMQQDFVRTARAKGLSEWRVTFKHALRNALLPIVTLLGLYLPFLFSGAVFIETVFAWPGMGKMVVDAITARDAPLVMGGSLVFAAMVVIGNLVADVLYAVVDPRVRGE